MCEVKVYIFPDYPDANVFIDVLIPLSGGKGDCEVLTIDLQNSRASAYKRLSLGRSREIVLLELSGLVETLGRSRRFSSVNNKYALPEKRLILGTSWIGIHEISPVIFKAYFPQDSGIWKISELKEHENSYRKSNILERSVTSFLGVTKTIATQETLYDDLD